MRVARQASATATGGLVFQLNAEGHDEGNDTCEERLTIANQLEVRRVAPEIDGDGTVCSRRLSRCAPVSPLCQQVSSAEETPWESPTDISRRVSTK